MTCTFGPECLQKQHSFLEPHWQFSILEIIWRPLHSPGHLLIPVQHVCKLGSWRSPAFGRLVCTPDPWSMLFSSVPAHHNSHFITLLNCITVYLPVGCVDVTLQGKFQYRKWNTVPVTEPDQQEEHYIRSIKRCEWMWGFFCIGRHCTHLGYSHGDLADAHCEWYSRWNTPLLPHRKRKQWLLNLQEDCDPGTCWSSVHNTETPKVTAIWTNPILHTREPVTKLVTKKRHNHDYILEHAKELLTMGLVQFEFKGDLVYSISATYPFLEYYYVHTINLWSNQGIGKRPV